MKRVGILASEFAVGKAFADYLRRCHSQALDIVQVLAVIETKNLFINVLIEMERPNGNVSSAQRSLQEQSEVSMPLTRSRPRTYASVLLTNNPRRWNSGNSPWGLQLEVPNWSMLKT